MKNIHSVGLLFIFCLTNLVLGCTVTTFDQVPTALETCDDIVLDSIEVPAGETLTLHLRSGTAVTFRGTTTFGYKQWLGPLVEINGTEVIIQGEDDSVLDGQGPLYWDGLGEWGTAKPTFFNLQLHNSVMNNIHVLNNPVQCAMIYDSTNVVFDGWTVDASLGAKDVAGSDKAGHNTDGFIVWNSSNIVLTNSVVSNQDDCVCTRCGSNILIDNFVCYGSHGLSISVSCGNETYEQNHIENVTVRNSILMGSDNGIHIKTHVDGAPGLLQNVTYENIQFEGILKYGINIQENYRNLPPNSTFPDAPSNHIPIKNLTFNNIVGIVEDEAVPIYILCADEGCFDWTFTNVLISGSRASECNYVPTGFEC